VSGLLKSWKSLGIQPTTTSTLGLARTLSEEEISKIQEQLSQFDVSPVSPQAAATSVQSVTFNLIEKSWQSV
jgi:hypothetical protein